MRATVLTDARLEKQAGRFVWLSIDTEDEKNATFLDAHPWEAVPTFEVIQPKDETVAYRWLGSVDAPELIRRLDEAEHACQLASAKEPAAPTGPDAGVVALSMAGKHEECATSALSLLPGLPPDGTKANVASTGLDCALSAPKDAAWRADAVSRLEAATHEAVHYDGLLDDDRSGLYASLVDARDRQDDEAGGKAVAVAWLNWLDDQARTAPSVEARAALDGNRVSAAERAGSPAHVLATIQRSERELPQDYNPPARLAIVLGDMGQYDAAIAASDRALKLVYGPRKLTILNARATILEKKGDKAGAKDALRQAIAYAATLPESQRPAKTVARLEKRLGQLGTPE